ncbi:MAG: PfkB family carbohydrate kinase [Gordonia sp. (in: high G+C Gram-positive bacteria)]|uniref:PfkB family carbohydrate kinase n=1 Tax=Gordonia sp. (in: high G+C Gram-positive bacteria) TaxID=84139 RepID=UPI003C78FBC0
MPASAEHPTSPSETILSTAGANALELDVRPAEVVVFGSQLAFGSVGLNAGLPVYAESTVRCAAIPTVILSNLPHYPSVHGIGVPAQWITDTLHDLAATGALRSVRAIAVGYLAAPDQAHAIADWYRELDAETRPQLILDPTFGDADVGFYTDPAVAPAVRDALVPLAMIVTPNTFELEHLSARPDAEAARQAGADVADVIDRAQTLRTAAAPGARVVITGLATAPATIGNLIVSGSDSEVVTGPELSTVAKGLGDTFAARLVSRTLAGDSLRDAVDAAAGRVRAAIAKANASDGPAQS